MSYRVLLFSILRERIGASLVEVELPERSSVGELLKQMGTRYPDVAAFADVLRVAVNLEYAEATTPLQAGDEIALITPTSGG